MPGVGPALPPELQKRKRSNDNDDGNASDSDSADSAGPLPARPPPAQQDPPSPKRSRVIGPTLPPAPLDERPSSPAQKDESESESSDDDDGFGPSLPSAKDALNKASTGASTGPSSNNPASVPAKRDEWMTLAPESGDWSQRVDPTKLKNRKFNTGRGAKSPAHAGAAGGDSWHETPEEKLARLQREAMGVEDRSGPGKSAQTRDPRDDAVSKRMKDYNVSSIFDVIEGLCIKY